MISSCRSPVLLFQAAEAAAYRSSAKRAKVLLFDGAGRCIYMKRLHKGRFAGLRCRDGSDQMQLTTSEIAHASKASLCGIGVGCGSSQLIEFSSGRSRPLDLKSKTTLGIPRVVLQFGAS